MPSSITGDMLPDVVTSTAMPTGTRAATSRSSCLTSVGKSSSFMGREKRSSSWIIESREASPERMSAIISALICGSCSRFKSSNPVPIYCTGFFTSCATRATISPSVAIRLACSSSRFRRSSSVAACNRRALLIARSSARIARSLMRSMKKPPMSITASERARKRANVRLVSESSRVALPSGFEIAIDHSES